MNLIRCNGDRSIGLVVFNLVACVSIAPEYPIPYFLPLILRYASLQEFMRSFEHYFLDSDPRQLHRAIVDI